LLSTEFLGFDSSGIFTQKTYGTLSWKCPVGTHEDRMATGCRLSSKDPGSYWVFVNMQRTACPFLEACES